MRIIYTSGTTDGLGLSDFLGQVIPVWLRELQVVSSLLTWGWCLEFVLNSVSGNNVAVDSLQHCQPSCLSSVLEGGPL